MVKNNIWLFVFAFTFFVSADQNIEIEKSYHNTLHIKEHLSVNKKANIYKVIASSDDLSLSSVTIDMPKEDATASSCLIALNARPIRDRSIEKIK